MIRAGTSEPAESVPHASIRREHRKGRRPGFASDTFFHAAVQEMEAIGLRVRPLPHPGSAPYGVLSGRTGSRFFLLPARPRAVSTGSLALVQPVRLAPRAVKGLATVAVRLGLAGLLPHKVHVSGAGDFARLVDARARHGAFLTGTPGPHRKLSVQLMDDAGHIQAYAKVSLVPAVQALLQREAEVLRLLAVMGLRTAWLPCVLRSEVRGGTAILATNAVRTCTARCLSDLDALHLDFLEELAACTASAWARSGAWLLAEWCARIERLRAHLAPPWRERLDRAVAILSAEPALVSSSGLAHGDFTPVNSFRQDNRLCVFDWEYAGAAYPGDHDLICLLDAVARLGGVRPDEAAELLERRLVRELGRSPAEANRRLIAFYCVQALRGAERQPPPVGTILSWCGADEAARTLDALLARASGP
jgi:hypothetical protein